MMTHEILFNSISTSKRCSNLRSRLGSQTVPVRASGKFLERIFSCAPSPFRWLQIPLFGVVTNVKGGLDETGRDLIVQRRGRR